MNKLLLIAAALALMSPAALAQVKKAEPIMQVDTLTPGKTLDVNMETLCLAGYTGRVRNVSEKTKKEVFARYGIDPKEDKFEIDHLISLELGGSNDIENLWPQSYTTQPWNAHVKDKLENRLHRMVCDGQISLKEAQKAISTNWIAAYKKYYGAE